MFAQHVMCIKHFKVACREQTPRFRYLTPVFISYSQPWADQLRNIPTYLDMFHNNNLSSSFSQYIIYLGEATSIVSSSGHRPTNCMIVSTIHLYCSATLHCAPKIDGGQLIPIKLIHQDRALAFSVVSLSCLIKKSTSLYMTNACPGKE